MTCWQCLQRNPDFFRGLNKGRPDAEDLIYAEEFVRNLKQKDNRFLTEYHKQKTGDLPGFIRGTLSILEEMG
jgi:hypothetical protein